jgi:hypothetical protein
MSKLFKYYGRSWNILILNSLINHLNGKTISNKMGPKVMLTYENDTIVIGWTLVIQECRPSENTLQ